MSYQEPLSVKFTAVNLLEIPRRDLKIYFAEFGDSWKLFVHPEFAFAQAHFTDARSALRATEAINKPNRLNLQPLDDGDQYHYQNGDNTAGSVSGNSDCSTMEVIGDFLFDIHGNKVSVLSGGDGLVYLPFRELKACGIELFKYPVAKPIYDAKIDKVLRQYLQTQAFKFTNKYNCKKTEEETNSIIESVMDNIYSDNPRTAPTAPQPPYRSPTIIPERVVTQSCVSAAAAEPDSGHQQLRRPKPLSPTTTTTVPTTVPNNDQSNDFLQSTPFRAGPAEPRPNIRNMYVANGDCESPKPPVQQNNERATNGQQSRPAVQQSNDQRPDYRHNRNQFNRGENNVQGEQRNAVQGRGQGNYSKPSSDNHNQNDRNAETASQYSANNDKKRPTYTNAVSLPLNESLEVTVLRINARNQKNMFLSLVSNSDVLKQIDKDITNEASEGKTVTPIEGMIYAALYSSKWYRVEVIAAEPLFVSMVDYGMRKSVTAVLEISESLQSKPWQAIRITKRNEDIMDIEVGKTYLASAMKQFDDGTYVFTFQNEVKARATSIKSESKEPEMNHSRNSVQRQKSKESESSDVALLPAGITIAQKDNTNINASTSASYRNRQPIVPVQPKANPPEDKKPITPFRFPSIVDTLREGMKVMVEFHPETFSNASSAVCFISRCDDEVLADLESVTAILEEKLQNDLNFLRVNVMDLVAVEINVGGEDTFVRGLVIKIEDSEYTIARVDYATVGISKLSKIRKLPANLSTIPFFTCVCKGADIKPLEKLGCDGDDFLVCANNRLSITVDKVTYNDLTVVPWNPFETHATLAAQPVIITPPDPPTLKIGDLVRILKMNAALTFYVQTRNMYSYYKTEVESVLAALEDFVPVRNPLHGQVVIVKFKGTYHRSVISQLTPGRVTVEMIDIGTVEEIPVQDVFSIDATLASKLCAYVPIKLKNLTALSDKAKALLQLCIEKKTKFTIVKVHNDATVEMVDDKHINVIDQLKKCELPSAYLFKNIKHFDVPIEKTEMTFSYLNCENGDTFFMCDGVLTALSELVTKIVSDTTGGSFEPYHPIVGEICLGVFTDEWCRIHVISADKDRDQYFVYFFDFGNYETIQSSIIRKLPDASYSDALPVATKIVIKAIKENFKDKIPAVVVQLLDAELVVGSKYVVDVLTKTETDTYLANIPHIAKGLEDILNDF